MKKKGHRKIRIMAVAVTVIIIVFFAILGSQIWSEYTNTLMGNQIEQLSLTARSLGEHLTVSISEYEDNLDFLCRLEQSQETTENIYTEYVQSQSSLVSNVYREDENGRILESVDDLELTNPLLLTQSSVNTSIWQMEDADGNFYLVFKRGMENNENMCMVIDSEEYYQRLISNLHVGTNGYVAIKNAEGILVMHPNKDQWGITVIEGRKELYPDLDYSGLEQMMEEQKSGEEGISDYYSYWWTNPELPRVRKINAYAPVDIGDSFWVVSAVTDYDDLYVPIQNGLIKISFLFLAILIVICLFTVVLMRLMSRMYKTTKELEDLREMNELLERMQRSEESIAHQQRLQIMGTVTGGIAHEFNNFLTPIMGYAQLLMMELPEGSEEQMEAAEIYEASEKAQEVVRQISGLSRRNVETVYKTIQVKKQIQRALKMIESVCPPHIRLENQLELEDESILGNTTQINQVILNICINAVHAIGKKEGRIFIGAEKCGRDQIEKTQLDKLSGTWKEYIHLTISDDGCGMSKETLRHIFEPFFTTKAGGEGTGLGLALVHQIILSHKGYIYAKSKMGEGTTFHIYLPVLEGNATEIESNISSAEYRIVVADDNVKVLEMLQKNFENIGIHIATYAKMQELQKNLSEQSADVLVIDESISGANGIDFCMSIAGVYPDMLKVVMVDGINREVITAMQKGVIDGYVEKPVSDTTILEAIRKCTAERM